MKWLMTALLLLGAAAGEARVIFLYNTKKLILDILSAY